MLLTKNYLKGISERRDFSFNSTSRQQVLNENIEIFKSRKKYDLFLSHSFLDKALIYTLIELFNKSGYSIYVDWLIDTQLDRSQVNIATSDILRKRMDESKGLAYIATSNSSQSKWCPWELGYEDGKTNGRCVILPVLESQVTTFKGQEYLGLYPYLEYAQISGSSKYDFWVYDSENKEKYTNLSKWLTGINPSKH